MPLGLIARDPRSGGQRRRDGHAGERCTDEQHHLPLSSVSLALFQFVEPDAEQAGDQLQLRVELAVLAGPGVRGDRLAANFCELAIRTHLEHERVRETLPLGVARLAVHDQAEDPVLAAQALEGQDFLVHPARLG